MGAPVARRRDAECNMSEPSEVDKHLVLFLRGRDVSCPGCGYNLRDLASDRCPECGQELEVGLRLVEPRQGPLIAGLVGLAAGAGLGGLLLIYALIMTFLMGASTSGEGRFFAINSVGFVAHGIVLLLWVRNWGRIRRASPVLRRTMVLVCWAMPLAFVVVFAGYIR